MRWDKWLLFFNCLCQECELDLEALALKYRKPLMAGESQNLFLFDFS